MLNKPLATVSMALVFGAGCLKCCAGDRRIHVQLASVPRDGLYFREVEHEISERLVGHLAPWEAHHVRVDRVFGFLELPVKDKPAYPGKGGARVRVAIVVGASGPERILVQLQDFAINSAEDHSAESAIAERESFDPLRSRAATRLMRAPRIASLPEVRQEKVLELRRKITEGRYDVSERLDMALDKVLEDLTT